MHIDATTCNMPNQHIPDAITPPWHLVYDRYIPECVNNINLHKVLKVLELSNRRCHLLRPFRSDAVP